MREYLFSCILILGSETLFKMQKIHPPGELKCSMCMNLNKDPVCPANCGHCFCKSCWRRFIEKAMNCPVCTKDNMFRGNQPVGYMTWRNEISSLAGYEEYGTIVITYNFKEGIQGIVESVWLAYPSACILG